MALTKSRQVLISNATIASGSSLVSSGSVDLSGAIDFGIGYTMAFNASATGDARIELYADPSGANSAFSVGSYDDYVDAWDILKDPGHTVNGFCQFNRAPKYAKVKVINTTGQSLTGVYIYAIVQAQA